MIQAENVVKTFEGFRALDGLNIHVPKGAIYGLVGPNGAGKSTFIRHLAGIYRQDSGTVQIDGQDVFENPAVKSRIAYIPDDIPFFLQAGVRDMMRFYSGIYPGFDKARYEKLKLVFAIDERQPMRKLSKGMQKQAAFWLALSMRPDVLILDEPVDGLDPVMRRQVWSLLMGDVAENGTTVLVSSHNLRELEDVCDNICLLHSGGVIADSDVDNLKLNLTKVHLIFEDEALIETVKEQLNVIKLNQKGKIYELTLRGNREEIVAYLNSLNPVFIELLSLSLVEVFINEMEVSGYEIHSILADS